MSISFGSVVLKSYEIEFENYYVNSFFIEMNVIVILECIELKRVMDLFFWVLRVFDEGNE